MWSGLHQLVKWNEGGTGTGTSKGEPFAFLRRVDVVAVKMQDNYRTPVRSPGRGFPCRPPHGCDLTVTFLRLPQWCKRGACPHYNTALSWPTWLLLPQPQNFLSESSWARSEGQERGEITAARHEGRLGTRAPYLTIHQHLHGTIQMQHVDTPARRDMRSDVARRASQPRPKALHALRSRAQCACRRAAQVAVGVQCNKSACRAPSPNLKHSTQALGVANQTVCAHMASTS